MAISKPPNAASTSTGSVASLWRPCAPCRTASEVCQVARVACRGRTSAGHASWRRSGATARAPRSRASRRRCRRRPPRCPAARRRSPCRRGSPRGPGRATSRRDARVARAVGDLARQQAGVRRHRLGHAAVDHRQLEALDAGEHRHRQLRAEQACHQLGVRARPGTPMPSTARPWSDANSTICGERKRGLSVFWIRPRRMASGSSSPRLPVVSLRRCSLSRRACSSSGFAVGVIRDRLTDMVMRNGRGESRWAAQAQITPRRPHCAARCTAAQSGAHPASTPQRRNIR